MTRRMRRQRGRDVQGVLLLDKPVGITSNAALQEVKLLYQARKAGHTGSLDPIATGLLPLCLGEATKISSFLLGADKRYQATLKLGEATDTGDAEGTVTTRREVEFSDAQLTQALVRFKGEFQLFVSDLRHESTQAIEHIDCRILSARRHLPGRPRLRLRHRPTPLRRRRLYGEVGSYSRGRIED